MATFNLKKQAKKDNHDNHDDHDDHIERRLKNEHKDQKNMITEKQLKDYITETEVQLTEKQLEDNRGGPEGTTEARLNASTSKLMKHRDESTHIGDINKLEEQRLANKPVEKEEYKPASETPKALRWWEKSDSPDGLKLAQSHSRRRHEEPLAPAFGPSNFGILDDDGEFNEKFDIHDIDDSEDIDDPDADFLDDEMSIEKEKDMFDVFDIDDVALDMFTESEFKNDPDRGIISGEVKVQEDIVGNESAIDDLIDFLIDKHPELSNSLTVDSLNFSRAGEGIIGYIVQSVLPFEASTKKRTVKADLSDFPSKKK